MKNFIEKYFNVIVFVVLIFTFFRGCVEKCPQLKKK